MEQEWSPLDLMRDEYTARIGRSNNHFPLCGPDAILSQVRDVSLLLKDLTKPQLAAATHVDGPLLIIAGAGSGKTRVITRRVAYLLAQGVKPWSILAITFTNKAAGEMKSRVAAVMDRPLRDVGRLDQNSPLICTFHSLCLRILRHYAARLGLPANFSIYDTADQNKLIKEAVKTLDISTENFSPSVVHGTISNAKNQLQTPEAFAHKAGDFYARTVARIYAKYQKLLTQNNAMDFDDLLLKTTLAMRDHPDVLEELQRRFTYLMIDEYQDTNHAQYVLAHALAQRHKNICVVGDPDQSIYAWRGADIKNILSFENDYPGATVIRLEQNYRSTARILRIASKLIENNSRRKDKSLWTKNVEGEPANLFLCQDEHDEAAVVTEKLRQLHGQCNYQWSQMAIFYRMNALSRVMEDALRKAGVPYQIARGVEFYNRKEIKDALAYLRVVANPADEVSLDRIINVPTRGLGDAAVKTMSTYGVAHGLSLWHVLQTAPSVPGLSPRAVNAARSFTELVTGWRKMALGPAFEAAGSTGAAPGIAIAALGGETAAPGIAAPASGGESPGDGGTARPNSTPTAARNGDVEKHEAGRSSGAAAPWDDGGLFPPGPLAEPAVDVAALFAPSPAAGDLELEDSAYTDEPDDADGTVDPETVSNADAPRAVHARVRDIAEAVIRQSGLEAYLKKTGGEDLDELRNVQELISSAADFEKENPRGSLHDFLAQVSLVSDADHMKGAGGAVTLMTLHAAKGLEFPVVAVIGLEEGILPHSRARDNVDDLEEERRLFFVGITRAQERLMLSKAARRTLRGVSERTISSPFIHELPPADVVTTDRTGLAGLMGPRAGAAGRDRGAPDQTAAEDDGRGQADAPSPSDRFPRVRKGAIVRHAQLGIGRILDIQEISPGRTRADVKFNHSGLKTIYLEYARLEVLDV